MSRSQLELKLIPVSKKLSKKGGYRGHIVGRREMGYDEVIEEAIKTSHLNFDSIAMKMNRAISSIRRSTSWRWRCVP